MDTVENVASSSRHLARPAFETTSRGRWISVAGAAYVTSWIVGLLLAPQTPGSTAPDADIHAYYADSGGQILVQSSLIHGLAGLAIAALAVLVPAAAQAAPRVKGFVIACGFGAALVSLLQVAFAVAGVVSASSRTAGTSAFCFDAVNRADTLKLVLLAGFAAAVATAGTRAGLLGRWARRLTWALVVALPVGGLGFVADNPVLTIVLYASLPLLLIWAAVISWQLGRRAH